MNEVSSFVLKKFRYVWIGKKKLILICQNTSYVLQYLEKVVFGDTNLDLYCDDKKMKSIFIVKKNKLKMFFFFF